MASDHFSTQAAAYAQHRPKYPDALFDWLKKQVGNRGLAWDCACGSGQATSALATRFQKVIGTDISSEQLRHAPTLANGEWRVAPAEASQLPNNCADLVTVAQALHWFDLPRFWAEAQRVLRPGGVIAAWCYAVLQLPKSELQIVCDDFYENVVGDFWPPERRIVEAGYGALEFPFREIVPPNFELEVEWSLDSLLGYFSSWSATTRYQKSRGESPIPALRERLKPHWPREELEVRVRWPISLRVGRNFRAS